MMWRSGEKAFMHSNLINLNTILEPIRREYKLPALSAAVILDGMTIAIGAVGLRKVDDNVEVTPEDKFHLGSASKPMSATMIAVLVEHGKLKWENTLSEVFPEFSDKMLPKFRTVTLRQLLSHRAGLPTEIKDWPLETQNMLVSGAGSAMEQPFYTNMFAFRPLVSTDTVVMIERRLMFTGLQLCADNYSSLPEPGTRYMYSNAGYMIAASCAERVTGTVWEELVTDLVFKPLGMTTAGFGSMSKYGGIDQPWSHTIIDGQIFPLVRDLPPLMATAGCVHMSVGDWARFITAHLEGYCGRSNILKAETYHILQTSPFLDQTEYLGNAMDNYTLGWALQNNASWAGGPVLRHQGSNDLNWAEVWMVPKRRFAVLMATNICDRQHPICDEAAVRARDACVQLFL